jgi:hypothetical protein
MFLMGMSLTNYNMAMAAEAQLVKIQPVGDLNMDKLTGLYIDPRTLYIDKNTIVVWMNGVPKQEVQVVFQDGKACRDVTANPMGSKLGFKLDAKECYVTSFIPYADTSSLQFPESGTFYYFVQNADATIIAKGKIEVRK